MFAIVLISFREFLEAFLLVGIFIGMDQKLHLGKRREILLAALFGILFSLILPLIVFFFANAVQHVFTEKNVDILEGYFLTFSGFFIAYVVFSLHEFIKSDKKKSITQATKKMEKEIFDISLFLTIIFFIAREGFEVALLVAATSIFSVFQTNIIGLFLGFFCAFLVGFSTLFTYIKLPIKKVFLYTEYFIILVGAAMVKNGISILLQNYAHISLEKLFPIPLQFIPADTTIFGHVVKNLFGLQKDMSITQLMLMGIYILIISRFFLSKKS